MPCGGGLQTTRTAAGRPARSISKAWPRRVAVLISARRSPHRALPSVLDRKKHQARIFQASRPRLARTSFGGFCRCENLASGGCAQRDPYHIRLGMRRTMHTTGNPMRAPGRFCVFGRHADHHPPPDLGPARNTSPVHYFSERSDIISSRKNSSSFCAPRRMSRLSPFRRQPRRSGGIGAGWRRGGAVGWRWGGRRDRRPVPRQGGWPCRG